MSRAVCKSEIVEYVFSSDDSWLFTQKLEEEIGSPTYSLKLAQAACVRHACLRAPCVLACAMRSLAIVFTIVQSFSLSFLFFFSLRLLLLTHFGESPVCENMSFG